MLALTLIANRAMADEPEPLLLALRVDGDVLSDALQAVAVGTDVRLPIGELARLLELDASADLTAKRILLGGRTVPFDAARMTATEDDIFAGAKLLSEWFSLQVTIDLNASTVTLHASTPLPFQLRRAREQEAAKAMARSGSAALPRIPNPYSLFDGPFVDARIRMNGSRGASQTEFDLFATGDLAGLSAHAFASGTAAHPLASSWLTLGRRDPDPILLGPLHAREAEVGEVFFSGDDLVALPRRGDGFAIGNFPLDRARQFDQQTMTGDLRPGEDVELYVNGALAGYARGGNGGGHYTFADIPVIYGLNVFRLVFYDARGQERVETRTYNVGDSLTPKGTLVYHVVATDGRLAEAAYGMTRQVTVTATATSIDLDGGARHDYLGAGVRATFGGVFGYGDVTGDIRGGTIARVGLQTQLGPVAVSASRAQLQAFTSEIYRDDFGPIAARTTFRLGGAFGKRFVVPVRFDVAADDLAGGGHIVRIGGSLSTAFGRLWVTSSTQATLFRNVAGTAGADSATGTLRFSRFAAGFSIRGEMGYEIRPRRTLTTATIAADWRHFRNFDLSATYERNLATHVSRSLAGIRHDTGRYAVAFSLEMPTGSSPIARVELSTSLLHNPLAHRWIADSRPSAAGGALAALVFLDRNANGVRDDGEPPIAGAGFFVNRGASPVVTDAEGRAFLDRLPADSRNEVVLSTSTLEDPAWAPASPGAAFVARAGKALVVGFPVVVTGEITGTVSRNGRPAAAIRVDLIRADGANAATTATAYDGFYDFTGVKPGQYEVRVAGSNGPHLVTISVDHTFDNVDFTLTGEKP